MVEGRSHSRSTRYTTIAIKDVPYPNGLGKTEYEALYDGMVRLLGSKHYDQDTNADMFWTPQYQRLIATRLEPYFGRRGSIIANASKAAEMARGISIFDRELAMDSVAAEGFTVPKSRPGEMTTRPLMLATGRSAHHASASMVPDT